MTGEKNGLTGNFLRVNPHLKNTHCSAHRIALVSEQAAENVPAVQDFRKTLESIYYYFYKSPARCDQLESIQKVLEDPVLRVREVHSVRWSSFFMALETVYRTIDYLIFAVVAQRMLRQWYFFFCFFKLLLLLLLQINIQFNALMNLFC